MSNRELGRRKTRKEPSLPQGKGDGVDRSLWGTEKKKAKKAGEKNKPRGGAPIQWSLENSQKKKKKKYLTGEKEPEVGGR